MKVMQKRIAYLLSMVLIIFALAACGTSNKGKEENKKPNENANIGSVSTESETEDVVSKEDVTENDTQTSNDVSNSEKPGESEESNNSEKPDDTQKPGNSEKPSDTQKPGNSEKPSDTQKPGNSEKPSDTQKPSDSQKPENSEKPSTPTPSEPEATIPSSAPGWSKVPSFVGSSLSEKEMAVKVVECIISSSMSDFEKALEIHDWLIFNVDYDHSYSNYYAKNAFVDRRCVCQGYAEAFELMAEAAGLDATFVSGVGTNSDGRTESHAWNQVKINGSWYNVDVTWDDPTHAGKDFNDHSGNRYDYFLVSKSQLEKDHRADSYAEGEKSCASNYDKVTVLKTAANTGRYGDVAVVTNVSEANTGIKKYMDKNKSAMTLWIYDPSVNEANSGAYLQNLSTSLQYMISLSTYYPSNNGVLKCPIGITPSSEWNAIPVVRNVDEFKKLLDEKGDAGIKTYKVRYESTNGTPVVAASKYGFGISYYTYNGGNWWLIDVTIS